MPTFSSPPATQHIWRASNHCCHRVLALLNFAMSNDMMPAVAGYMSRTFRHPKAHPCVRPHEAAAATDSART
jgi:hypothetical protein